MTKCLSGGERFVSIKWVVALALSSAAQAALAAAPAAPAALAAAPAPAETSPSSELEEVTVTAEFRKENLQDTPVAITAITAQTLESRGQSNLLQLSQSAPNVDIQPAAQGYGAAAVVSIRGIGQRDSSFAFEPGVGVYIDDVYFPTLIGNVLDLLDLDRVEILRGPQGTLAGKNSIGGALKLFSKMPNAQQDGYLEGSYGSYNLVATRGATNITLIPDSVFARVSVSAKHQDGYLTRMDYKCTHPDSALPTYANSTNCVLGHEGGVDDVSLRSIVRWLASDNLDVTVIGDFNHNNDEPTPNALVIANPTAPQLPAAINGVNYGPAFQSPNPYTSYSTYSSPNWTPPLNTQLESYGTSANVDYRFSDSVSLKSITAYRQLFGTYTQDADASPFDNGLTYNPQSQRTVTQEIRLNATLFKQIDLTTGGFYYDGNATSTGRIRSGDFLNEFLNDRIRSKNKSGFLHAIWHITDAFDLTGGVRYTDESKSYRFNRSTIDGSFSPFVNPLSGLVGDYHAKRWDYRGVLDYRLTDSVFTYVQYSTGFKGGGINPRPYYQNQVAPFGPETLDAYEIGLKSDFFGHRARLNLAAFYNRYDGIQIQTLTAYFNPALPVQPDPTLPLWNPPGGTFPAGVYKNAGNADMKGLEAEFSANPTERFSIDASLSYLNFKYTSLTAESLASGITPAMTAPFSPRWKGSLGLQYEASLGNAGTITPRLDYNYQTSSFAYPVNSQYNALSAYGILNAHLTYSSPEKQWQLIFAVANVTDKFYWQNKFDFYGIQGFLTGLPSRPREYTVTVKRNFF